jgi:RNA polymerase sigma-70 factor (ECF subfamily)
VTSDRPPHLAHPAEPPVTGDIERPPANALDEYLVVECQLGNAEAFRALVRRWHGRLVCHAQTFTKDREAALDAAQESWMGIIRGLARLRDPAMFPSWAMRIAANKARDWVRREQSRRGSIDSASATDRQDTSVEVRERVRDGLARLDPAHRDILRLHYLEGRPIAVIASELGIPEGTVKSRLSGARDRLRLCLEEDQ